MDKTNGFDCRSVADYNNNYNSTSLTSDRQKNTSPFYGNESAKHDQRIHFSNILAPVKVVTDISRRQ